MQTQKLCAKPTIYVATLPNRNVSMRDMQGCIKAQRQNNMLRVLGTLNST